MSRSSEREEARQHLDQALGMRSSDATLARCSARRTAPGCPGLLSAFLDDAEVEIAWNARDALLEHDAEAALEDASLEYKLDVLPRLMLRADRDTGEALRDALSILMADEDPLVRELAAAVIHRTVP